MKINRLCVLMFVFLVPFFVCAQDYLQGRVRVIVHDHSIISPNNLSSSDSSFSRVLNDFAVVKITQPLYFAKTPELQRLYELQTTYDVDSLLVALENINKGSSLFLSIEKCSAPKLLATPADYMWWLTINDPNSDYLWPLQKIHAPEAWDITKGDTNVIVAILDNGVDCNHPDLK